MIYVLLQSFWLYISLSPSRYLNIIFPSAYQKSFQFPRVNFIFKRFPFTLHHQVRLRSLTRSRDQNFRTIRTIDICINTQCWREWLLWTHFRGIFGKLLKLYLPLLCLHVRARNECCARVDLRSQTSTMCDGGDTIVAQKKLFEWPVRRFSLCCSL